MHAVRDSRREPPMDAEASSLTRSCPPHHWLIDDDSPGGERWSCRKCGLVRTPERRPIEPNRLANVCTWSRDEVALVDVD
jgi:hypothetical protein